MHTDLQPCATLTAMDYDPGRLVRLGRRRAKLLEDTKANMAEIAEEIPAARRAGLTQERVAALTGLTRVTVAKYWPKDGSS